MSVPVSDFQEHVSDSIRAGLAKSDVIRAGAKVRGHSKEPLTEKERRAAEVLADHYQAMLVSLKSHTEGSASAEMFDESTLSAFGGSDFAPPAPDPETLANAVRLLQKLRNGKIGPNEADRLLALITEIQFGRRTTK
jgi:hypothetical protein